MAKKAAVLTDFGELPLGLRAQMFSIEELIHGVANELEYLPGEERPVIAGVEPAVE